LTALGAGGAGGFVGRLLQASVHLVVQRREVLQRRLWLSQVVQGDLERRQNLAVEFVQDRKKRLGRRRGVAVDRLAVNRLGYCHASAVVCDGSALLSSNSQLPTRRA
jgi:hypothetical protein